MFSLNEKHVLITGGTSGIGLAVAKRFTSAGANVVVTGRREATDVAGATGVSFIQSDVSDERSMIEAFAQTTDLHGKLDVLINNAGIQDTGKTIAEHSSEDFDKNVAILQKGVFFGLKYGPGNMNDGGSIINTSSVAAATGVYGFGQYSMAKAAVEGLSRVAAIELAPRCIRVNTVLPGTVRTPMVDNEPQEIALTEIMTPLARIAETDDVVGLYHFLASEESRYITGQQIAVDGGLLAGPGLGLLTRLMA